MVGVVLLGLGWGRDHAGFCADKAFLTKVFSPHAFSSVTTASFGVPLALVILNRVAIVQAKAVEARAWRCLAMRVAFHGPAAHPEYNCTLRGN